MKKKFPLSDCMRRSSAMCTIGTGVKIKEHVIEKIITILNYCIKFKTGNETQRESYS